MIHVEFISPAEIGNAVMKHLQDYNNHMAVGTRKAVEIVSEEVMAEIKRNIKFEQHTGEYVSSFALKKVYWSDVEFASYVSKYNGRKTWHVGRPYYTLTHLLEKGHKKRNGGMTRAYPHIVYGDELAKKRLQELILKVAVGEEI